MSPKSDSAVTTLLGVGQRQDVGPEEDSQEDLDHDLGNGKEAAAALGDDRG